MRYAYVLMLTMLLVGLTAADSFAQGRGRGETSESRRADSRRDRDGYYDRDRKGNGPAFCENGRGHPVHGWRWCVEKGYGRRGVYGPGGRRDRWEDRTWKDIVFGDGRDRDSRRRRYDHDGRMDRDVLRAILGKRVYRRFDDYRRSQRLRGAIVGHWIPTRSSRTRVLQLNAGDVPLAILADYNGDGRVDAVRVNRLR